jgi:O-antigen/teichoic acid export membrane protein
VISQDPKSILTTPQGKPSASGNALNGDRSITPFFIVGLGRSGTTLLSRMLDANSALAVFPETWCYVILDRLGCLRGFQDPWQYRLFLQHVWDNLRLYNDPAARVWAEEAAKRPSYVGPTAPILESLGRAYAEAQGAQMWGEKTPGHILWLPHIHHLFPKAKVIVTVRDPRDVLVSYDDRWGGGRRDTAFLMDTAALVRYYLRRFFDEPGFPSGQFFLVKYEELTSRPVPLLKKLCEFLEVDFQPGMVEFYEHSGNWITTPEAKHHALLSKPATAERVGRYRTALTSEQISLVDKFLAVEMQSLGYAADRGEGSDSEQRKDAGAVERAHRQYARMQAGVFRERFRRRGKLVLRSYKHLGRALALLPARRVASTSQEWLEKAASTRQGQGEQLVRSMGPTPDEQMLGVKSANDEPEREQPPDDRENPGTVMESAKFRQRMGQISQHSAVFFVGTMFTGLAGYLFKVYLARMIGAHALGVYALGMTIVAFLGVFNGLGLSQSAVRFVALYTATGASNQLRGFLLRALTLLLCMNIVLAIGVVMVGPWVAEHVYHTVELKRYFPLFSLIMLLGALTSYGGQVLQGYKDVSRRTVITNFIGTPLVILLTIVFLLLGWGLWGYIFAQVVGALVVLGLLVIVVWKLTPPEVFQQTGPLPPLGAQVVSFGGAALGISLLEFLLGQTDKILIGFYINARELGIYAVAMAIVAFVPIALQSVNQIFSPTIADLHSRGEQQLLGRLFQTLTKWIFAFTLPLATVVIVFAKPLMGIFGTDFLEGWPVLVVGVLGQLINCGTGSVGYLLLMSGNQKRLIKVQATMAVVIILLNLVAIPRWGIVGAAFAAAITMVLSNAWYLREVKTALGMLPFNRSYLKLVLPCIAMASATVAVRILWTSWTHTRFDVAFILGGLMVAYAVFFGAALSHGLDADDRIVGRAVWSKLRGSFRRGEASS